MLHPRAITTYIHRMQDSTCWRDQRAYRVEFAALLTYMILAVLAAIGLESFSLGLRPVVAAVHVLAVTLVIPLFCSLFFPLPNQLFIAYSYFTVQGAAISRLLQVVLWIDFSYDLNDTLFGHARDVHRRTISGALHKVRAIFIALSCAPGCSQTLGRLHRSKTLGSSLGTRFGCRFCSSLHQTSRAHLDSVLCYDSEFGLSVGEHQ